MVNKKVIWPGSLKGHDILSRWKLIIWCICKWKWKRRWKDEHGKEAVQWSKCEWCLGKVEKLTESTWLPVTDEGIPLALCGGRAASIADHPTDQSLRGGQRGQPSASNGSAQPTQRHFMKLIMRPFPCRWKNRVRRCTRWTSKEELAVIMSFKYTNLWP